MEEKEIIPEEAEQNIEATGASQPSNAASVNDVVDVLKNFKPKKSKIKIIVVVIIVIAVLLAGLIVVSHFSSSDNGSVNTITQSSLEKVLEVSDLSTVSNTYNGIVRVNDEKGEVLYYVAYEGTVKIGIDFSEIQVEVNEEEKKITITIPETKVLSAAVDMGTLEYIFNNKKSETETVSKDAYKYAKEDLLERANAEEELHELAKENAIDTVTALIKPWVNQIDNEYTIVIA